MDGKQALALTIPYGERDEWLIFPLAHTNTVNAFQMSALRMIPFLLRTSSLPTSCTYVPLPEAQHKDWYMYGCYKAT